MSPTPSPPKPRRLARWLPALALLASLLGLLHGVTLLALRSTERAAEAAALTRVSLRAEAAEQLMARLIEGWIRYFEMLQDREQLAVDGNPMAAGIQRRLSILTEAKRFGVHQAAVIDPDGVARWTSQSGPVEVNVADRPHFVAHLRADNGIYISEPVIGRVSGRWSLQISRRITNAAGGFAGVAVLSVDPLYLGEQLAAASHLPGETVSLSRSDGLLVAISNLREDVLTRHFTSPARPGPDGWLRERRLTLLDGEDRFIVLRQVAGLPAHIGVSSRADQELAEHATLRRTLSLTELAVALLLISGFGVAMLLRSRQQERQETETLQAARAELARVMDGLGAVVFLQRFLPDGKFRRDYMNAEAFRVLGVSPGNIELLHQALDAPGMALPLAQRQALYQRLEQDGSLSIDMPKLLPDGSRRWARIALNVIGRHGKELEVVGLVTDISAEREAEAAREQANHERLQAMTRVLNGLAATTFVNRLYPDGSYQRDYLSPNINRLLGASETLPQPDLLLRDRMVPEPTTAELAFHYQTLCEHGAVTVDRQMRMQDGSLRWVRCAANVIGRRGEELEVVGLLTDIHAERMAEAEREAADKQRLAELYSVLDGVEGAVFLSTMNLDTTGYREYMNAGGARLLRLSAEGAYHDDRVLEHLEPPLSLEDRLRSLHELHRNGITTDERQLRCADGSLRWARFTIRVISRSGDSLRVVGLVTDVETEKAAEAAAMSHARLATLGEMASGLAHEMNQPLTVISLSAETATLLLQQDAAANSATVQELHDRIFAMTRRAKEVIDHLRLFARQQQATMERVALGDVVAGALLLTGGTLREHGVVLEQDLPEDLPPVRGRQVMLEQVLMNLLINADQAMEALPETQRKVRISAQVTADRVMLKIQDSGPGLPANVLPRLFEPFFTTKPPGEGTGLGLSICHGILKACGGEITAANAPEGGAVFTLHLLQDRAPAAAGQQAEPAVA